MSEDVVLSEARDAPPSIVAVASFPGSLAAACVGTRLRADDARRDVAGGSYSASSGHRHRRLPVSLHSTQHDHLRESCFAFQCLSLTAEGVRLLVVVETRCGRTASISLVVDRARQPDVRHDALRFTSLGLLTIE